MSEALRLADALEQQFPIGTAQHYLDGEAAAELRRLHKVEEAYNAWHEKTEWVQDTSQPCELGMHRADVLRWRIERLVAENESLKAVNTELVEALRRVRGTGVFLGAIAQEMVDAALAKTQGVNK